MLPVDVCPTTNVGPGVAAVTLCGLGRRKVLRNDEECITVISPQSVGAPHSLTPLNRRHCVVSAAATDREWRWRPSAAVPCPSGVAAASRIARESRPRTESPARGPLVESGSGYLASEFGRIVAVCEYVAAARDAAVAVVVVADAAAAAIGPAQGVRPESYCLSVWGNLWQSFEFKELAKS